MARKGDNIYKRKDGRWEGRFVKGKGGAGTQFGYVFAPTYQDVKERLAAAKSDWQEREMAGERKRGTLAALAQGWMEEARAFLKESTIARYNDYLRSYILPAFGGLSMERITNEKVTDFCQGMLHHGGARGQGLSAKTVAETVRLLKHLRKYASLHGYMVGFAADCVMVRQVQKTMRVLSSKEQEELYRYLRRHLSPHGLGILLCLFTGVRLGELCALTWDDISLGERNLRIRRTMQRIRRSGAAPSSSAKTKIIITPPKSNCSIRTIPLPMRLCRVLAPFCRPGAFLLTGSMERFMEPRTMQNHFKAVLSSCGIETANFHALRHTFATRCVEAGFDVKCLSVILGHANVSITLNRYVHPTPELKRQNMEKLSCYVAP